MYSGEEHKTVSANVHDPEGSLLRPGMCPVCGSCDSCNGTTTLSLSTARECSNSLFSFIRKTRNKDIFLLASNRVDIFKIFSKYVVNQRLIACYITGLSKL